MRFAFAWLIACVLALALAMTFGFDSIPRYFHLSPLAAIFAGLLWGLMAGAPLLIVIICDIYKDNQ